MVKLELKDITKRFGSFTANYGVDLAVESGEILCLLGENGAGKSTLMNVLCGLYEPDEGEIVIDGTPQHFSGPGDAIAAGIGMVHQHFMLIPVFTVAENIMLGHEQTGWGGTLDLEAAREVVRRTSARFGFDVDPDAVVENLPVGVQQRVEIIKALSRDARVLVFDEPTAVLTPQETDELIVIMRELQAAGTPIIFISHKLREVREVATHIKVIRRGRIVGEASPAADNQELASLMVGRQVKLSVEKADPRLGEPALVISDLCLSGTHDEHALTKIDLTVHRGEIVAIAGVQGNGQTELAEAIMGLQPTAHGSIVLDGNEVLGRPVRQILESGVGFVPEDRTEDGLIAEFSIAENLMLDRSFGAPFVRRGAVQYDRLVTFAREKLAEFDVRAESVGTRAGRLSGGNQQKVVLAREMSRDLRLLLAAQPTRGLDVGSIEFVHSRIVRARDEGTPVLVISTELDEVIGLADRIAVMYRGRIVGVVPGDTSRDVLGLMMAGEAPESAA